MPLGLTDSEAIDGFWSQNTRRKVFYSYPNGTAPLTGLLSLADTEDTPMPEYGWNEERWQQIRTTTAAGPTSNTVFYIAGTTTTAGTTVSLVAGTSYRIYLTAANNFQIDDMIKIHRLSVSGVYTEASFRITVVQGDTSPYYVEAEAQNATGALTNNSATLTVGIPVVYSGSAFAEGSRSRTGRTTYPSEIINYTQIFKTAFEMSGTALKAPTKYDKTGAYKDQLKKNGINHLSGIEWSLFFGDRRKTTAVDPDTGITVRRSFMGGLLWFLKQWEEGSVTGGGAFEYGQTDVTAETDYITHTNKRIIRLGGNTVTLDTFNEIESRPFERTNSTEWCKLCLCGPGYIGKVNARLGRDVQVTQLRGEQYEGWDFQVTKRTGLAGTIYYKQHPLFTGPEMRNSAFYVDCGYLKYRPLTDRDTDIQPMIQLPDADKRKDQWLSECGFEIAYPEAHMFVESLGGITL